MAEDDIVQRIVLTGNVEVVAAFAAIQEAGTKAFETISEAAKSFVGADESVKKIQETAEAVQAAQQGVVAAQREMAAASAASGAATAEGMSRIEKASKSLQESQLALIATQNAAASAVGERFGGGLRTAGLALAGLAAGIGIAITGLFEFVKGAANSADEAGAMSEKFGDTVENTDALISALGQMGANTGELGNAFRRMAFTVSAVWTQVQKESKESADNLKGDSLSIAQAYDALGDASQKAANAERDAANTRKNNALSVQDAELRVREATSSVLKSQGVDTSAQDAITQRLSAMNAYQHAIQAAKEAREQAADAEEAADRKSREAADAALKAQLDLNAAKRKAEEDAKNDINNVAAAVAKLSEGSPDALKGINASAENIVRGIVKNVGDAANSLAGFKGDVADVGQQTPQVREALFALADVFKNLNDNALKTAISMRFFGRAIGQSEIEALSEGSEELKKHQEEIKKLGFATTDADVAIGRSLKNSFAALSDTVGSIANKVATQLMPPFTLAFQSINRYFEENGQKIITWANNLAQSALPAVESFARVLLGVPEAGKDDWLLNYVQDLKLFGDAVARAAGVAKQIGEAFADVGGQIAHVINAVFGTNLNAADVLFAGFVGKITGGFSGMIAAGRAAAVAIDASMGEVALAVGAVLAGILAVQRALALIDRAKHKDDPEYREVHDTSRNAQRDVLKQRQSGEFDDSEAQRRIAAIQDQEEKLYEALDAKRQERAKNASDKQAEAAFAQTKAYKDMAGTSAETAGKVQESESKQVAAFHDTEAAHKDLTSSHESDVSKFVAGEAAKAEAALKTSATIKAAKDEENKLPTVSYGEPPSATPTPVEHRTAPSATRLPSVTYGEPEPGLPRVTYGEPEQVTEGNLPPVSPGLAKYKSEPPTAPGSIPIQPTGAPVATGAQAVKLADGSITYVGATSLQAVGQDVQGSESRISTVQGDIAARERARARGDHFGDTEHFSRNNMHEIDRSGLNNTPTVDERGNTGPARTVEGLDRQIADQKKIEEYERDQARRFNRDIHAQGGRPALDSMYNEPPVHGHYDETGSFVSDRRRDAQLPKTGAPTPLRFKDYEDEQRATLPHELPTPLPRPRPPEASAPFESNFPQQLADGVAKGISQARSSGGTAPFAGSEPPPGTVNGSSGQSTWQQIVQSLQSVAQVLSQGSPERQFSAGQNGLNTIGEGQSIGRNDDDVGQNSGTASSASGLAGAFDALKAAADALAVSLANAADNGGTQTFSGGGHVQGAGSETSDNIPAMLSHNEYVHNARAVNHYGLSFMHAVNSLKLPKFSLGGLVSGLTGFAYAPVQHFATGGPVLAAIPSSSGGSGGHVSVDLRTDHGHFAGLMAPDHVARQLSRAAVQRQTVQNGTKPTWFRGRS